MFFYFHRIIQASTIIYTVKDLSLNGISALKKSIYWKTANDQKCKMLLSLLMTMTTKTNKQIDSSGPVGTCMKAMSTDGDMQRIFLDCPGLRSENLRISRKQSWQDQIDFGWLTHFYCNVSRPFPGRSTICARQLDLDHFFFLPPYSIHSIPLLFLPPSLAFGWWRLTLVAITWQ